MLCCFCQKPEATVHLTQIAGERIVKLDLCENCAKEKGVNDPAGFSLAELLQSMGVAQDIRSQDSRLRGLQ